MLNLFSCIVEEIFSNLDNTFAKNLTALKEIWFDVKSPLCVEKEQLAALFSYLGAVDCIWVQERSAFFYRALNFLCKTAPDFYL